MDVFSVLRVTVLHGLSVPGGDLEGEYPYPAPSETKGPDTAPTGLWLSEKIILWGGSTSTSHL